MKIDGGKPLEKTDAVRPRNPVKNEKASDIGREAVADKVNVSGKARGIAELAGIVKSISDDRADKVEEIKSRIDSGNYVVDAYKIAGKMIDEVI